MIAPEIVYTHVVAMINCSTSHMSEITEELVYISTRITASMSASTCVELYPAIYLELLEIFHSGYYGESRELMRVLLEVVTEHLVKYTSSVRLSRFVSDRTGIITGRWSDQVGAVAEPNPTSPPWLEVTDVSCNRSDIRSYRSVKCVSDLHSFKLAIDTGEPCVVRGGCGFWKACATWSRLEFWEAFAGSFVPVELGTYLSGAFQQKLVDMFDFLGYVFSLECQHYSEQLYLAQYDILARFPALVEFVNPLPDFVHLMGSNVSRSVFIGPKGTVSPLHTDPSENFFCQIVGYKYVLLFQPIESVNLYVKNDEASSNTTQLPDDLTMLNGETIDAEFPRFNSAIGLEAHLSPGDCLYIPRDWFHFVKSASAAVSLAHFID